METNFLISWTARPNFRFSGGGGSVCVVFFWARNTTLFSKEWTNIIDYILVKETCIKACCTVVSERATAYWRIPFQNNAIFPARNTILLQMTIPCIALYYRHITLFKGIVIYIKGFPFVQQLTVNHTILSHTLSLGLLCVLKATSQRDATYFWKEDCG